MSQRIPIRLLFTAAAVVAAAFALGPSPAGAARASSAACTTSWASATSGLWNDATKWSAGVPDAADDACITVDGDYTVTLEGAGSAHSLTLGATTGTQTLLVGSLCGPPTASSRSRLGARSEATEHSS